MKSKHKAERHIVKVNILQAMSLVDIKDPNNLETAPIMYEVYMSVRLKENGLYRAFRGQLEAFGSTAHHAARNLRTIELRRNLCA